MTDRPHERLDCSDWEHLLGVWSDYRILKEYGVSRGTLGRYRKRRGIKAVGKKRGSRYGGVDWAALFESEKSNTEIARIVGCSVSLVGKYWRRIYPGKPLSRRGYEKGGVKDKIFEIAGLLGQCSDVSLARRAGLSRGAVRRYRRKLEIPAFEKVPVALPKKSLHEAVQDRQRRRFEKSFTSKGYSVDDVIAATDCLTDRESDIFIARYGLHGCGACTLKKVGDKYGLSRERIRQLEEQATRKVIRTLKPNKEIR